MGLKILHSADWHLDSPFARFPGAQRENLKEELLKIPQKVAQVCRREGCDIVLLSGDLFDGPYTKNSLDKVRCALEACGVPVFISPGNHDFVSPDSPWVEAIWPENVHIFTGGLESVSLPALDCRIWGAGYQSMDCPGLLEGFRASGPERYQLAVLHGDPVQPGSPCCPITLGQIRDSGLHYLALGHIHKTGSCQGGKTLCVWPGPAMGRGYDETGERGVYVISLEEKAKPHFAPLDTPRFYDLELDVDRQTPEEILPAGGNNHFYRITLTGSGEGRLTGWEEGFPNLELVDHREPALDPWALAGEDTLVGTYFQLLREKLEDAGPEASAFIQQAAEISARLLNGREVAL